MSIETITFRSAGTPYVPKFFHAEFNAQIDYLQQQFGDDAVRRYLHQFVRAFHTPLIRDIQARGLVALKEYWEKIYRAEGAPVEFDLTEDELVMRIPACPAVRYMRERGIAPAALFFETARTVNEALVEGTPFAATLLEYDAETGRSVQQFYRRSS
jgi:hypothetical protein